MPSVLLDLKTMPAILKGSKFRTLWIAIIKLTISFIYYLFACLFSQKLKAKLYSMSLLWLWWNHISCTVDVLLEYTSGKGSLLKYYIKKKKGCCGWCLSRQKSADCCLAQHSLDCFITELKVNNLPFMLT